MMTEKESASRQMVFAANTCDPALAFSGVFPDDFSAVLDRSTGVVSFLVSKHLMNTPGLSKWFDCLMDADNKLVEISKLEAKSIAELGMKLDLYNLVWQ